MIDDIVKLFERDLGILQKELELFKDEKDLWKTYGNISNSAGNLCLHLIGNLSTYIGKNIGETGYVRDRDAEFALKHIPRAEMLLMVENTKKMIPGALKGVDPNGKYVENVLGYEMTNGFFLIHLLAHFSYHLGQINYLRRILK